MRNGGVSARRAVRWAARPACRARRPPLCTDGGSSRRFVFRGGLRRGGVCTTAGISCGAPCGGRLGRRVAPGARRCARAVVRRGGPCVTEAPAAVGCAQRRGFRAARRAVGRSAGVSRPAPAVVHGRWSTEAVRMLRRPPPGRGGHNGGGFVRRAVRWVVRAACRAWRPPLCTAEAADGVLTTPEQKRRGAEASGRRVRGRASRRRQRCRPTPSRAGSRARGGRWPGRRRRCSRTRSPGRSAGRGCGRTS